MLTRRAQFSWSWWVVKSAWMLRWPAAERLVQAAAVHRPVGDQALDPVSSLEEATNSGGESRSATACSVGPRCRGWVLEYLVSLTWR